MKWIARCFVWGFLALGLATGATAHFKLNLNVRVFHIVHGEDDLDVFVRMPMAYLVAGKLGPVGVDGLPTPAPFTTNRLENGVLTHLVDTGAFKAAPLELAAMAARDLRIRDADGERPAIPVTIRLHALGQEPGFATLDEARAALSPDQMLANVPAGTYVGDTLVDLHLRIAGVAPELYAIAMLSDPGLPEQDKTANLILDYRDGVPRTFRAEGLMTEPIGISGSAGSAAVTFVAEGIRHIIEGIDHVLFVICLVIGAPTLGMLAARVTGFTIGHSVTLAAGSFGLVPSGDWFIPTVETAIAISIIYAAADALFQRQGRRSGQGIAVGLTTAIGLLHGFGFSFMLREILQVDAQNVWQSLLAFNVGVEIGQLAIVLVAWPVVLLLRQMPGNVWIGARGIVAVSVSVVAAVWAVERMAGILA